VSYTEQFIPLESYVYSVIGDLACHFQLAGSASALSIASASFQYPLEKMADFSFFSAKAPSGPWLLFVSEGGYGKRVPLGSFRTSRLNRVGLVGYKVCKRLPFLVCKLP